MHRCSNIQNHKINLPPALEVQQKLVSKDPARPQNSRKLFKKIEQKF